MVLHDSKLFSKFFANIWRFLSLLIKDMLGINVIKKERKNNKDIEKQLLDKSWNLSNFGLFLKELLHANIQRIIWNQKCQFCVTIKDF